MWVCSGEDLAGRPVRPNAEFPPLGATEGGRWVDAQDVQPGDVLLLRDGSRQVVSSVAMEFRRCRVYNLSLDGHQNDAVGHAGWLVHNAHRITSEVDEFGGYWHRVGRRDGPSLQTQAEFSEKDVAYIDGKPYIEEYHLDGVDFDRFQDGVLGEV